MLNEYVEYIETKFDYSDDLIKIKQWLDKKNKNNDRKTKTEFYIFEKNILFSHYTVWSREIISNNIKKQQEVIYITLITNVILRCWKLSDTTNNNWEKVK